MTTKKTKPKTKPELLSEQVLARMEAHEPRVRQSHLARDLDVTPVSVLRWLRQLDEGVIGDDAWSRIARMLRDKYGIDVSDIRPIVASTSLDTSLTPYLDIFAERKHLEAIVKILEGSHKQEARDLLLVIARDRLARG